MGGGAVMGWNSEMWMGAFVFSVPSRNANQ